MEWSQVSNLDVRVEFVRLTSGSEPEVSAGTMNDELRSGQRTAVERQIEATDRQVDAPEHRLYWLSDDAPNRGPRYVIVPMAMTE